MAPYLEAKDGIFAEFVLKELHEGEQVEIHIPVVGWFIDLDNRANPIFPNSVDVPHADKCKAIYLMIGDKTLLIHGDVP
jgi:hypothetical protein